ncbi:conserved hypothetical protein [Methanococcus vannielii SB]|uniref:YjeF C-terminal domain-containing protein n=2 Tax=Methanococcus vannielii TaxID=2187 RepID=A6UQI7_METVS|nr:conserved hypothetical protein [Methanococcus vannielii SB]
MVAGAMPIKGMELVKGQVHIEKNKIFVKNKEFPITMGSGALVGAAFKTLEYFGMEKELIFLTAGDVGEGEGSLKIYRDLNEITEEITIIHYIKPKISEILNVDFSKTVIGDAGGMYAGKAAGIGDKFRMFFPDVGELAFLADDKSSHPAYVRGFISKIDDLDVPKLIEMAYFQKMPDNMVVKGEKDYIVQCGKIIDHVANPKFEAMECIGGTGDTLTGITTSLIACGFKIEEASILGCKLNRKLGEIVNPKPDTKIYEIIKKIPEALKEFKL